MKCLLQNDVQGLKSPVGTAGQTVVGRGENGLTCGTDREPGLDVANSLIDIPLFNGANPDWGQGQAANIVRFLFNCLAQKNNPEPGNP